MSLLRNADGYLQIAERAKKYARDSDNWANEQDTDPDVMHAPIDFSANFLALEVASEMLAERMRAESVHPQRHEKFLGGYRRKVYHSAEFYLGRAPEPLLRKIIADPVEAYFDLYDQTKTIYYGQKTLRPPALTPPDAIFDPTFLFEEDDA